MEVQILTRKCIKASAETHQSWPQNVKTSFTDQLAPSIHAGFIMYYVPDTIAESLKMRNQLEKSLSEALTFFFPLAGRYIHNDLMIECNNEGVAFWEARVNGRLANIVHGNPEPELQTRFFPLDVGMAGSATTPLLAIQDSVFECGGLAIGIAISHKVADAISLNLFMDAWANTSRGATGEVICPSFEFGSFFPARFLPELNFKHAAHRGKEAKMVTRIIVFDETTITSLKAKAGSTKTRLDVVSALIWKALIGTSQAKHGHLRPSLLVHAVNLRGKTALPIAENAFGNFFTLATAQFRSEESKMQLGDIAGLVGDAIRDAVSGCAEPQCNGNDDLLGVIAKSFADLVEAWFNEEVDTYACSSLCSMPFYETDFGWGKPAWISSKESQVKGVCLMDTKCGKGIEVFVSLDEQDMFHFQQDKDIAALLSKNKKRYCSL